MSCEFRKYIDIIIENSKEDLEFLREESLNNNHLAIAVLGSPASGKTYTVNQIRNLALQANQGKIAGAVDSTSDDNVVLTVDILRSKIQSQKPKDQLLGFFMAYNYIKNIAKKNPKSYEKWFNQIQSTWQKMDDLSDEITTSISPDGSLVFNGSSDSSQVQKIIAGLADNEVKKIIDSLDQYNDYKRVVRWFQNDQQKIAKQQRKNIVYDESGDEPDKIIERFAELRSGSDPYITLVFMIHGKTPVTNLIQNAYRMVSGGDNGRDSSGAIIQAWNDIQNQMKKYITASEQVKLIRNDPDQITDTFKTMLGLNTDDNVKQPQKSIDLFTQILPQDPKPAYERSIKNLSQMESSELAIKFFNAILLYFANYLGVTEDSKKTIYELVGNQIPDINAVFQEVIKSGQFNHPLNNLSKMYKKISNTSNQAPPERKVAESKKKGMKLYCDVDGVLADFDNGTKQYTSKFSNNWEDLPPNFFSGLDKLENSKEFVTTLKEMFKDNFYILTAIPKPHRGEISKRAKKDKINWLEKNFNIPRNKIIVVYREQKKDFANPNSILIDDTLINVQEWNNQGGIGILFKDHNQAINKINSKL